MRTSPATPPGRLRQVLTVAGVLVLLVGFTVTANFGPPGIGVVVGPLVSAALLGVARAIGLTWDDLGMGRRTWRKGAAYGGGAIGLVGAVYLVGALLPFTSSAFLDVRYNVALGSALVMALVVIPLNTVLLEEIAFRGVLHGMLKRPLGTGWAIALSSTLFGLWHVLPAWRLDTQNQTVGEVAGAGLAGQLLVVAGVVVFTAVAGLLFSELRRRSGSVLAPAGLHWATNGLGVLTSSLVWAAKLA